MPLRLVPPRKGASPNWRIRGTYLRTEVNQTSGTPRQEVAKKILRSIEAQIERGEFQPKKRELDFLAATLSYLDAGGDNTFTKRIEMHFGETPLSQITQASIDAAAVTLYPDASPATRNRQVYTPVSAILRHAGVQMLLKRPKGAQGQRRLHWLTPEQASALIASATSLRPNFGALLAFLFATGCRLSEGLELTGRDLDLMRGKAFVPTTKNGDPRTVHLPPSLVAMLANTELGSGRERVFGLSKSKLTYDLLDQAASAAKIEIPDGIAFHITCHSWATWMRRYGGADTSSLMATGRWKSRSAAAIYEHTDAREEASRADLIPLKLPGPAESVIIPCSDTVE